MDAWSACMRVAAIAPPTPFKTRAMLRNTRNRADQGVMAPLYPKVRSRGYRWDEPRNAGGLTDQLDKDAKWIPMRITATLGVPIAALAMSLSSISVVANALRLGRTRLG